MADFVEEQAKVEVVSAEQGFENSYYTAKCLRIHKGSCRVKYETLHDDQGNKLIEEVPLARVRPFPPTYRFSEFLDQDIVDAYYRGGWWRGTVEGRNNNGQYHVRFENQQQLTFAKGLLRIHQGWDPRQETKWTYAKIQNYDWPGAGEAGSSGAGGSAAGGSGSRRRRPQDSPFYGST